MGSRYRREKNASNCGKRNFTLHAYTIRIRACWPSTRKGCRALRPIMCTDSNDNKLYIYLFVIYVGVIHLAGDYAILIVTFLLSCNLNIIKCTILMHNVCV